MKIVVIEDEKLIAQDLIATIKSVNNSYEIVSVIPSVVAGISFFSKNHETVDLIFSDIQLIDGLSFEIFKQVNVTLPIIFCTAFNEYALDAFKSNGIEYILKPFSTASVREALTKYENLKSTFTKKKDTAINDFSTLLSLLENKQTSQHSSVIIRQGDRIIPLSFQEVAFFFVEDGYAFAYTFKGEKFITSLNLEQLESQIGRNFYRANRQFLVNRTAIKDVSQYFGRKLLINLTIPFKEKITVGKLKSGSFLDWLAAV